MSEAPPPSPPQQEDLPSSWRTTKLNERERLELEFCQTYVREYNHGAIGHHILHLVVRLAELVDIAIKQQNIATKERDRERAARVAKDR